MQPTLTGPRVVLRPWRADDVDAVTAACQDPEIQRWTQVPVPYERTHAEGFVGGIAEQTRAGGGALFAVVLPDGAFVGSIGLFPPHEGVGEIGYWTAAPYRGRGLTSEAVRVLSEWAFTEHSLHRVQLLVHPANQGSRRVAERAGFLAEGVIRQRMQHRGRPADAVMYSRLPTAPRPIG